MKVLCLGNNSNDTDSETTKLAKLKNSKNYGLIASVGGDIHDGYYHTSVFDLSVGDIKILADQFDEVIFLDQPVAKWNHPDAYYLTVKILDQINKKVKVTKLGQTEHIKFFEDLVETNKSFCIFPFIELLVNNGFTSVCCRSSKPITALGNIKSWQRDDNYVEIRNKMLKGELIPDHCSSCYKYESQGIKSARQQETVEWANRLGLKSITDLTDITSPVYYEVRPGNICNLQCRSCDPMHSSLIEKEYIQLGWHDPKNLVVHTGFEFIKFDNIKKLYVAGGEPTAMTKFYSFMQKCIDEQNTDFEFLVNTNANKLNKSFLKLSSQFSNLGFIISIDGFKEANDYVRWGSEWETVISNAKVLAKNHKVTFNVVVSIYTISRLHLLLEFFDHEFPDCIIHCTLAEFENDILNPDVYPNRKYLVDKLTTITNLKCYHNDQLLESFINGIIKKYTIEQWDNIEKLKLFFDFNDALDNSRNVKMIDYIPELDNFRTMVLK